MEIYKFFQIFTLSYVVFALLSVVIAVIIQKYYESRPEAENSFFQKMASLPGRKLILFIFNSVFMLFLCCWLGLAIPFIDFIFGIEFITSSTDELGAPIGMKTWYGIFGEGPEASHYFITVFVGAIGLIGFSISGWMSDIFSNSIEKMT